MADLEAARSTDLIVVPAAPPPAVPEPAQPEEGAPEEGVMSLVDHLVELRHRLAIALIAVALGSVVGFLLSFEIPGVLEPLITAEAYFGFVTTMFLAFGLVMQFPIVLVLLGKAGIVDHERLRRSRRYVILIIAVFAVFITPGGDPVSPTVLIVVMYLLYELSIILVRWTGS